MSKNILLPFNLNTCTHWIKRNGSFAVLADCLWMTFEVTKSKCPVAMKCHLLWKLKPLRIALVPKLPPLVPKLSTLVSAHNTSDSITQVRFHEAAQCMMGKVLSIIMEACGGKVGVKCPLGKKKLPHLILTLIKYQIIILISLGTKSQETTLVLMSIILLSSISSSCFVFLWFSISWWSSSS